MREILNPILRWIAEKKPFALATVIKIQGSAPRGVGSVMAIRTDLQTAGSVSGGCIENAVIETAQVVIQTGQPQILAFEVSDETAWSVGHTCGGSITVLVEKHLAFSCDPAERKIWQELSDALQNNRAVVLLTRLIPEQLSHLLVCPQGKTVGDWGQLTARAVSFARSCYRIGRSREERIDEEPVFAHVFSRPPKLIIVGAVNITQFLVKFAKELDFETIVIDPRPVFASAERFSVAPDRLFAEWPGQVLNRIELSEDTYAVVLTHDPKIDDQALKILLRSPVVYIGALGSKKTHAGRCSRLSRAGFSAGEIERIHGPVGLSIHAANPAEIALSIIAEVVKTKNDQLAGLKNTKRTP